VRADFRIGFNEVAIGMAPPLFLLELARARRSKRHFVRATVQAEIYTPENAVDAGLLDRTVDPDRLFDEARDEAERLAKLPRAAYLTTRTLVYAATLERIAATLESNLTEAFGRRA
jgi:enoyl-CoA hydratase